jgi:hypothetical protein
VASKAARSHQPRLKQREPAAPQWSGRQDLNLRPPGPPARKTWYRWVEEARIHWVFCSSVLPGFAHFVPRFVPRTYVRLIATDVPVSSCLVARLDGADGDLRVRDRTDRTDRVIAECSSTPPPRRRGPGPYHGYGGPRATPGRGLLRQQPQPTRSWSGLEPTARDRVWQRHMSASDPCRSASEDDWPVGDRTRRSAGRAATSVGTRNGPSTVKPTGRID